MSTLCKNIIRKKHRITLLRTRRINNFLEGGSVGDCLDFTLIGNVYQVLCKSQDRQY